MADEFGTQPQFDTADFKTSSNACSFCKTALSAGYYRINGKLACANCVQQVQNAMPKDSHAAFVRAIIFGSVGALIGMALYAGIEIATKLTIGYLALGVGYIVAKAMLIGSGNIGGRRYQFVAVALTYAAISVAFVPVMMTQMYKQGKFGQKTNVGAKAPETPAVPNTAQPSVETPGEPPQPPAASSDSTAAPSAESQPSVPSIPETKQAPKKPSGMSLLKGLGMLLLVGLASPFLELADPVHGAIGLVILFVGLNIAWRMTAGARKVSIEGPY
jgi:hypothetical protein